MAFPIITLAAAGVLTLIYVWLSIAVVRQRLSTKTSLGEGAQTVAMGEERTASPLFVAARTHANFAEYVPLSLVMLLILELVGAPQWALEALACTLVLARLLHPIGMRMPGPNLFRGGGMVLQWLMLTAAGIYALVLVVLTR